MFIESSAKTATGVREAFVEVVEKVRSWHLAVSATHTLQIIDTPDLWQAAGPGRAPGPRPGSNKTMPGAIQLDSIQESEESAGGCSC